jgi:hypothetical protein
MSHSYHHRHPFRSRLKETFWKSSCQIYNVNMLWAPCDCMKGCSLWPVHTNDASWRPPDQTWPWVQKGLGTREALEVRLIGNQVLAISLRDNTAGLGAGCESPCGWEDKATKRNLRGNGALSPLGQLISWTNSHKILRTQLLSSLSLLAWGDLKILGLILGLNCGTCYLVWALHVGLCVPSMLTCLSSLLFVYSSPPY